jgi:phage repressor protein C with HTH and peptisase S24 domain
MLTDKELIELILKNSKDNQTAIAKKIGCQKSFISQIKNGTAKLPKAKREILESSYKTLLYSVDDDCITIEHIGIKPECGNGVVVYDEPDIRPIRISADTITRYMRCSNPSNLKAFTARGDSMRPLIDDGDTVLVDIGRTDIVNQGVFVFTSNNEWRIKRLNLKLNGTLEVISDNPTYEKEYLTPDDNIDIVIRGRVVLNLSRSL